MAIAHSTQGSGEAADYPKGRSREAAQRIKQRKASVSMNIYSLQRIQPSFIPLAIEVFYRCPTNSEKSYA
jgi:hypothetical protein